MVMTMRWLQDPEIPELPSEADSPVLQLSNIVTDEDIKDDEAIEEVTEDLKEQCEKFGTVVALQIPKKGEAGAGKVPRPTRRNSPNPSIPASPQPVNPLAQSSLSAVMSRFGP